MKLKALINLLGGVTLSLTTISTAFAETAEEKGYAIAKERKQRDIGWGNSQQTSKMILRNAQGEESVREIRIKSLEIADDGDKGLTIFDKPADVKGTAFLSFSHISKPDDQWLYLPALKRVKRISSRNKSGPFMGSEFSYEDLSSFELEKYTFKYLRDDVINGEPVFVIESTPVDRFSGYSKQISWIDQKEYRAMKIEFYDRKKSHLKTLVFEDYRLYLEKYWRPHTMTMTNHQNKKSTVFTINSLAFNVGLTKKDFNKNSLKRAK